MKQPALDGRVERSGGADGRVDEDQPRRSLLDDLRRDEARLLRLHRRLRARARHLMASEGAGHTLDPTGLVHEMLIRVWRDRRPPRTHEEFLAAAAPVMRRILVDWARRRARLKRGGHLTRIDIAPGRIIDPLAHEHVCAVDRALERLEAVDPEAARVALLRHFGGLTIPETARVLGVSPRSVDRLWAFARARLARDLDG